MYISSPENQSMLNMNVDPVSCCFDSAVAVFRVCQIWPGWQVVWLLFLDSAPFFASIPASSPSTYYHTWAIHINLYVTLNGHMHSKSYFFGGSAGRSSFIRLLVFLYAHSVARGFCVSDRTEMCIELCLAIVYMQCAHFLQNWTRAICPPN